MQGIPAYDKYRIKIDEATEEAEVRNAARDLARDGDLKPRQQITLLEIVRQKLDVLTSQKSLNVGKPGGEDGSARSDEEVPTSEGKTIAPPGPKTSKLQIISTPIVSPDEMKDALGRWNAMAEALTDPARDLVDIHGNKYRRITFWRKVRKAYGIEMKVRSKSSDQGAGRAVVVIDFTAPNGDHTEGHGSASKAEDKLKKASEHEIMSRAYSRAFCRGLRDLVGFGEPSAEEVE